MELPRGPFFFPHNVASGTSLINNNSINNNGGMRMERSSWLTETMAALIHLHYTQLPVPIQSMQGVNKQIQKSEGKKK